MVAAPVSAVAPEVWPVFDMGTSSVTVGRVALGWGVVLVPTVMILLVIGGLNSKTGLLRVRGDSIPVLCSSKVVSCGVLEIGLSPDGGTPVAGLNSSSSVLWIDLSCD